MVFGSPTGKMNSLLTQRGKERRKQKETGLQAESEKVCYLQPTYAAVFAWFFCGK